MRGQGPRAHFMVLDFPTEGWNGQFHYLIFLSLAELDQEGSNLGTETLSSPTFSLEAFNLCGANLASSSKAWSFCITCSACLLTTTPRYHTQAGAFYIPLRFCRTQFHIYNQIGITITRIRRIMRMGTRSSLSQQSHQFSALRR